MYIHVYVHCTSLCCMYCECDCRHFSHVVMCACIHVYMYIHYVPSCVVHTWTKDLIAYKKRSPRMESTCIDVGRGSTNSSSFMTVRYHNKGIEIINLPALLHSKTVRCSELCHVYTCHCITCIYLVR